MAHLWVRNESDRWAVLPLDHDAYSLNARPPRPVLRQLGDGDALVDVLLVRTHVSGGDSWVLIASAGPKVTVNGIPLATGIRVVSDQDKIRVPNIDDVYFSSESLARVSGFPGLDQISFCPRCKQEIEKSASAVRCPSCGVWHHQTEELNCWTYADMCALCTQLTDLSNGFRWTPEDEEL
ncbi:MAG TPA: hypothetical protein VLM38_04920 [Blastocatellia bacterium]|nr:hypothetical protein [Blastocatellia bacterium]